VGARIVFSVSSVGFFDFKKGCFMLKTVSGEVIGIFLCHKLSGIFPYTKTPNLQQQCPLIRSQKLSKGRSGCCLNDGLMDAQLD